MRFRPEDDPRIKAALDLSRAATREHSLDEPDSPVEWEDNRLSNFFAWASYRLTPGWCQTPEHWTSRLSRYLFTDCPCCLLFRGVSMGFILGVIVQGLIWLLLWLLLLRP